MIPEQLAVWLTDQGVVAYVPTETGGDTFIGRMPPQPDRAVAVMAAVSPEPEAHQYAYDEVGVQFIVRGDADDPRDGYDWAQLIIDTMSGAHAFEFADGTEVVALWVLNSAPLPMGRDEAGLYEYSVNVQVSAVRPSAHRTRA